jgi:predicted dithiol-disulfide oxidoreductase (DUF899 family)
MQLLAKQEQEEAAMTARIGTREEWLAARKALLAKEKEQTLREDALAAERRALPMVRIDKAYVFEGPQGRASLAGLFEGRRHLVVYHFMFDPSDPPPGKSGDPWEEGCTGCSFFADNLPRLEHLNHRGITVAMVSRAQASKIAPFKARMGWTVPWWSSFGSDFNYDFHVTTDESVAPVEYNFQDKATLERKGETYHIAGEQPGLSVFLREGEAVFHTYSTYGRGLDAQIASNRLLDLLPTAIRGTGMEDVRHRDRYGEATAASCCAA